MNRARLYYWIDVLIGLAFAASGVSGLVFLLPAGLSGASQSGLPTVLGVTFATWSNVHTMSSIAMMSGVGLHLALHARWIRQMTRALLAPRPRTRRVGRQAQGSEGRAQAVVARPQNAPRRAFLRLTCWLVAGAACTGSVIAAARIVGPQGSTGAATPETAGAVEGAGGDSADPPADQQASDAAVPTHTADPEAEQGLSPTAAGEAPTNTLPAAAPVVPTATIRARVTCPRGIVYDRYPGRCRLYVDRNGDGYCDYSEPA